MISARASGVEGLHLTRRASERPHEAAWLVAIIVAGVAMRVAAIVGFVHAPESDELAYRAMAVNLAGGHGILDGMGNRAMYNAGYPLFILAPVFLVFGDNLLAARAANLVLGAVSIVLCHATAREAGADRRGRLLAAACWAF